MLCEERMAAQSDTSGNYHGHANGFMNPQAAAVSLFPVKRHRGENAGLHHSFFGGKVTVGEVLFNHIKTIPMQNQGLGRFCDIKLLCSIAMSSCLAVGLDLMSVALQHFHLLAGPDYYGLVGSFCLLIVPAGAPSYFPDMIDNAQRWASSRINSSHTTRRG